MAQVINQLESLLPENYSARPMTLDDAEAVSRLSDTSMLAKGYTQQRDVDDMRSDMQQPKFDIATSTLIVEDENGTIVGWAILWDHDDLPVHPWLTWDVLPEKHDLIAPYLIAWLEHTAQRVFERCPADAKISLMMGSLKNYEPRIKYFEANGYQHKRDFFKMRIDMEVNPPTPSLPDNITIRAMNYPDEFETVVHTRRESFRDHWGIIEHPLDEEIEHWRYQWDNDPVFDSSLLFQAMDGDKVIGICWGRMAAYNDPTVAYIDQVGVIPMYRKQGIALALLYHSFCEFWKRGKKAVTLFVDAESLTGATRLYEKAGMRAYQTFSNYEKVIRDGVELAKQNLDEA